MLDVYIIASKSLSNIYEMKSSVTLKCLDAICILSCKVTLDVNKNRKY